MDRLFLITLFLAEITRYKAQQKKDDFSLTNHRIEKSARERFAKARNFDPKSKPEKFIRELGGVYVENDMKDYYLEKLARFQLDPKEFEPITVN